MARRTSQTVTGALSDWARARLPAAVVGRFPAGQLLTLHDDFEVHADEGVRLAIKVKAGGGIVGYIDGTVADALVDAFGTIDDSEALADRRADICQHLLNGGVGALRLRPVEASVLLALIAHMDAQGLTQPSYTQIEAGSGATRTAIRSALQSLSSRGLLLVAEPRAGTKPARYLVGPEVWEGR
jgi:hypothetical protein